jgi:quinol monooxygenase YgiN
MVKLTRCVDEDDPESAPCRRRIALELLSLGIGIAALSMTVGAVEPPRPAPLMVRIAEVNIDPAQLEVYKVFLAEEQEASVRLEPGVLMLHSVALKSAPNHIRLLEVYASRAAYQAHLKTPHFIKYKTSTEKMVKSLRLIETTPILLCAKANGPDGGPATCAKPQ